MSKRLAMFIVIAGLGSVLLLVADSGPVAEALWVKAGGKPASSYTRTPAEQPRHGIAGHTSATAASEKQAVKPSLVPGPDSSASGKSDDAAPADVQLAGFDVGYRVVRSFPGAGTDYFYDTTGEIQIQDPQGGLSSYLISGPNVTVVERQDPFCDGINACTVQMELLQMDLAASDGFFDITISLNPAQPSLGQVVGADAANDYPADGFFDVFVTVDIPGMGLSGLYNADPIPLASYGMTDIRYWNFFEAWPSRGVGVELMNPDGTPSGYWIRYVRHEQGLPPCIPTADAQACEPIVCPNAMEQCVPTRVRRNPDGTWEVIECQCLPTLDACWVEFDEGADNVWCMGSCPMPLMCTLISSGNPDGSIDFWCECRDPTQPGVCEPQVGANVCAGPCPPGMACVPVGIDIQGGLICDCRNWDECRAYDDGAGGIICSGPCPDPDVCTEVGIDTDGDNVDDTFICDCLPPPPCEPTPDQTACEPVLCPSPNEVCVPTRVQRRPLGALMAGFDVGYHARASMFEPGGTDYFFDTGGEIDIEDPQGGLSTYLIAGPNLTVVERQDPVANAGAPRTVDMEIVQMDLLASDGFFDITIGLNPDQPSTGQAIGADADNDYPADSFFDVFVTIDIPGLGLSGLYNVDPIPLASYGMTDIRTWNFFECWPVRGNVELMNPDGTPSGYWIRYVRHEQAAQQAEWAVLACECLPPDACHVNFDPAAAAVWCEGSCPPGERCELQSLENPDGTTDYWCECRPLGCPYPCGDINNDGAIDLADFVLFASCFGQPPWIGAACVCSDLNGDQSIDLADFVIFAGLFGSTPGTNTPPNCP